MPVIEAFRTTQGATNAPGGGDEADDLVGVRLVHEQVTASPFSATSAVQQRQASEHITRDWPTAERVECARLLLKYPDATVQRPTPGSEDGPVAAPRRAVTYVP